MKCLVVSAHPLENSLCKYLGNQTINNLKEKGYEVKVKDLYKENFNPILSGEERSSYYEKNFDNSKLEEDIKELQDAELLILIFPTWWFSVPAILKGWFDRVWAPTYAYNHASDLGPITPCLKNLKEVKVITTLGAAWWVDFFILRKPVEKVLKYALIGACTKGCSFKMFSLYKSESLTKEKIDNYLEKIKSSF